MYFPTNSYAPAYHYQQYIPSTISLSVNALLLHGQVLLEYLFLCVALGLGIIDLFK